MMSSENIVEVTEASFQNEVIAYSNNIPVLVDFWAEWCAPCKVLSPLLEKLAREANGAFRLAKVNADENPNLVMRFNIVTLPTVKAFNKGQLIGDFTGAQSEENVRQFLHKLSPSQGDLALERGSSLLNLGRWQEAGQSFSEVLKTKRDDSGALLGLAKSLLAQGKPKDALIILNAFPASKEYRFAEILLPLASVMAEHQNMPPVEDMDELQAAFRQAVRLVGLGNLPAAADGLLEILRRDKHYQDDQARQVMLAVLELMNPNTPETQTYRRELSSVLF